MNPTGADGQTLLGEVVQHAVHEVIAHERARRVRDVSWHAGLSHGQHHRANRYGRVVGDRAGGVGWLTDQTLPAQSARPYRPQSLTFCASRSTVIMLRPGYSPSMITNAGSISAMAC